MPKGRDICQDHQIVRGKRVKVSENYTLARKRGIEAGAWRGKSDKGGREAAGDGATSFSVKTFQFDDIGNT